VKEQFLLKEERRKRARVYGGVPGHEKQHKLGDYMKAWQHQFISIVPVSQYCSNHARGPSVGRLTASRYID